MGGDSLPGKEALFMSVDIHNSEGYVDPTAFEALSGIEHEEQKVLRTFRPIVYICSPYAGDTGLKTVSR